MLIILHAPLPVVNGLFILCAASGPTLGVFAGEIYFFFSYKEIVVKGCIFKVAIALHIDLNSYFLTILDRI